MSTIVRIAAVAAGVVVAGSLLRGMAVRAAAAREQELMDETLAAANRVLRDLKRRRLAFLKRQREQTRYPATIKIIDEQIATLEAELSAMA